MHLNEAYLGKEHFFITKVSHRSLHLPICVLQHQMIMFELSENQHCILISSKVVD